VFFFFLRRGVRGLDRSVRIRETAGARFFAPAGVRANNPIFSFPCPTQLTLVSNSFLAKLKTVPVVEERGEREN
jgi:hypothetical protein